MERRKYKRASMIDLMEVSRQEAHPSLETNAININYRGLALYVKEPPGSRVYIKLYYVDGTGKKIGETVVGHEAKKGSTDSPLEAYGVNISYGGLAVYAKEPLGGRASIKLYFGNGTGKKIGETVIGHLVWQKQIGAWYAAGVKFEGLDPQDHSKTIGFLEWSDRLLEKGPGT